MKPSLGLRFGQHLALTPQLQQSIRLLQLSTLELEQEIEQQLLSNPLLERDEPVAELASGVDAPLSARDAGAMNAPDFEADYASQTGVSADFDLQSPGVEGPPASDPSADWSPTDWDGDGSLAWQESHAEHGAEAPARQAAASDSDDDPVQRLGQGHTSLAEHLHAQARLLRTNPLERAALAALIDSLDEDGYLADPIADLAASLCGACEGAAFEALCEAFGVARALLHSLEPSGVGAHDLAECLRLQLNALPAAQWGQALAAQGLAANQSAALRSLAHALVDQSLALLARHDLKRLTHVHACTEPLLRAALALITRLEPKPGRAWADVRRAALVPDVLVRRAEPGPRFVVELNPAVQPRLRVHAAYAQTLRELRRQGHAAAANLQGTLQEARWFIKNIQQRFETILRVSEAIVARQHGFFVHGELAMRPLVLRDIADTLGLHESTVSRVTNAKFMATPHGTFELKFFFGSGLATQAGSDASSTAVRALIRQFIATETPSAPLSDQRLADLLQEQGITCARRTVAKYREALRIPVASQRRQP